ncbi:MAG: prepilin-type N-terminal cleavage/methylation domain-containing protein, partial [Muribaculaceae bacterium]|nr:prepilin-type N-terminal cleavage/methylation domain-containing protein [Muribaculaceae bacterium]
KGEGVKFEHLDNVPLEIPQAKAAFTLSEVLITLGIIGIVAAITIPGLMAAYRRIAYPVQLKAVYSKLIEAHKKITTDWGDTESWNFSTRTSPDTQGNDEILQRFAAELSAVKYCSYGLGITKCLPAYTINSLNGESISKAIAYLPGQYWRLQMKNGAIISFIFATHGGSVWWFVSQKGYRAAILIDINGPAKPNIAGRDVFLFALKEGSNPIVPFYNDTNDCNKDGASLSCAKKIMEDDWKMNY